MCLEQTVAFRMPRCEERARNFLKSLCIMSAIKFILFQLKFMSV